MKKSLKYSCLLLLGLNVGLAYAAKPIDLRLHPKNLSLFLDNHHRSAGLNQSEVREISRERDQHGKLHIRAKQFFNGIPVLQGTANIHGEASNNMSFAGHQSSVKMNGFIYDDIAKDLPNTIITEELKTKALNKAMQFFYANNNTQTKATDVSIDPAIFIDKENKAQLTFKISFLIQDANRIPQKPSFIINANTLEIYHTWDDVKKYREVEGGGVGGNEGLIGKLSFDGLKLPKLTFERDDRNKKCYLQNRQVVIIDKSVLATPSFTCDKPDSKHNNVYWNIMNDYENGGYSPNNDAIYSDYLVRKMYEDWFNIAMLKKYPKTNNDTPMRIKIYTHDAAEGAWWLNGTASFGNGDNESYPVVAPSVVAHELSHGFTEQQSGLAYYSQSGGLNESFSDMADKAIEYYVHHKNIWEIDPEVLKPGGRLLRWMDEPTKDCAPDQKPGHGCSISHFKDYNERVNVHFSSGIFNKAFYLLANKWDTKKAFEVMVQANRFYWTENITFHQAACDVIDAAKDYKYDTATLKSVFLEVGIDTHTCK